MVDSLQVICAHFSEYNIHLQKNNSSISDITNFQILTSEVFVKSSSCLYILDPSEDFDTSLLTSAGNYLIFSDDIHTFKNYLNNNSNFLIVDEVKDKLAFYNSLRHCCTALKTLQEHSLEIIRAIFDKKNPLQTLVNVAGRLLNNPVALFEKNATPLMHNERITTGDITWDSTVNDGIILPEIDDMIQKTATAPDIIDNYTYPFFIHIDPCLPRLIANIDIDGTFEHFLIAIQFHRNFRKSDQALMHCMATIISDFTSQHKKLTAATFQTKPATIFRRIISGEMTDNLHYEISLKNILKHYNYLIMFSKKSGSSQSAFTLLSFLSNRTSDIAFVFGDTVLMVISSEEEIYDFASLKIVQNVRKDYKKEWSISISFPFFTFSDVSTSYEQCLYAAKIALNSSVQFIEYKSCAYNHFMQDALEESDIGTYISPKAREIFQFDCENNSEFVSTLLEYLKHHANNSLTASAMHVHRNTISYRLQRITELFAIDFSDYTELKNIEFSLKLLSLKR